jgi:hypothetical protein
MGGKSLEDVREEVEVGNLIARNSISAHFFCHFLFPGFGRGHSEVQNSHDLDRHPVQK